MSYLDSLPGREREKIRKRLRSAEEYERLRDRVKGPEDLERELGKAEVMAELHFAIESSPEKARELKSKVLEDVKEKGINAVFETRDASPDAKKALEKGNFTLSVESVPHKKEDALVAVPEGNVQEKIPVKTSFTESYAGQMKSNQ